MNARTAVLCGHRRDDVRRQRASARRQVRVAGYRSERARGRTDGQTQLDDRAEVLVQVRAGRARRDVCGEPLQDGVVQVLEQRQQRVLVVVVQRQLNCVQDGGNGLREHARDVVRLDVGKDLQSRLRLSQRLRDYASRLHLDIDIAASEAVAQDRHDLVNVLGVQLPVTHFASAHRLAVLGQFAHQVQTLDAHGRVLGARSHQERVQSRPVLLEGAHLHDHVADGAADARLGLVLENVQQEGLD